MWKVYFGQQFAYFLGLRPFLKLAAQRTLMTWPTSPESHTGPSSLAPPWPSSGTPRLRLTRRCGGEEGLPLYTHSSKDGQKSEVVCSWCLLALQCWTIVKVVQILPADTKYGTWEIIDLFIKLVWCALCVVVLCWKIKVPYYFLL